MQISIQRPFTIVIGMSMPVDQIPIGIFSKITRLTKRALRLYHEKEILIPDRRESLTGYRYYSIAQIETGHLIKRLSLLGFGICDIKTIIEYRDTPESEKIEELFRRRGEDIRGEIDRLEGIRTYLIERRSKEVITMEKSEPMMKEVPSMRVICIREKGTYQTTIPKLMGILFSQPYKPENQKNRVSVNGPPMFICHDEEYKEKDADIEVAIPIVGNIAVDEGIDILKMEGCRVLSLIHKGAYQDVGPAYKRLYQHIQEKGLKMTGPSREIYLNDPKEVPTEGLLTEVQFPVE